MSEKIVVPVLGESITEATVSKWLKNEGDSVQADEPIVELETDKVNLEVPSPVSGVLSEINSKNGMTVEVGALLGSVSEKDTETVKPKKINKIDPKPKENNIVNLEVSQKEPKIFNSTPEEENSSEEPFVLVDEIKKRKLYLQKLKIKPYHLQLEKLWQKKILMYKILEVPEKMAGF